VLPQEVTLARGEEEVPMVSVRRKKVMLFFALLALSARFCAETVEAFAASSRALVEAGGRPAAGRETPR
jgi:hypothetical protein